MKKRFRRKNHINLSVNKTALVLLPAPLDSLQWSTDFVNQTYNELKILGHLVFVFDPYAVVSFIDWFKYLVGRKVNGYTIITIPHLLFFNLPFLRRASEVAFLTFVRLILFALSFVTNRVLLWVFYFPAMYKEIPKLAVKGVRVLYDCVDYYSGSDVKEEEVIRLGESLLRELATIMVVNSHTLFEIHKKYRNDIYLVSQGFRLELFKSYQRKRHSRRQRPVIGFIGGINHRLNFSLLNKLVSSLGKHRFIFIGPKQFSGKEDVNLLLSKMDDLFSNPNVEWRDDVSKEEIPSFIDYFDIGIIPYDISQEYNQYCFPMKLFEYFYLGKPVVATPIEELKRFPKFVKIGATAEELVHIVTLIISKPWPTKYQKEQKKLAKGNSWKQKIQEINSLLYN